MSLSPGKRSAMKPGSVERWAFSLIYAGLLVLSLGLFTRTADADLGLYLMLLGGLAALAGAGLIYWRSRMLP